MKSFSMCKQLLQELKHVIPKILVCFLYCAINISNKMIFLKKKKKKEEPYNMFPTPGCPDFKVVSAQANKTELSTKGN